MEVGGELIMGFSESQVMNPRREMEDSEEKRMEERAAGQMRERESTGWRD